MPGQASGTWRFVAQCTECWLGGEVYFGGVTPQTDSMIHRARTGYSPDNCISLFGFFFGEQRHAWSKRPSLNVAPVRRLFNIHHDLPKPSIFLSSLSASFTSLSNSPTNYALLSPRSSHNRPCQFIHLLPNFISKVLVLFLLPADPQPPRRALFMTCLLDKTPKP